MAAAAQKTTLDAHSARSFGPVGRRVAVPLSELATLGDTDIETPLVANLSADLHFLFDRVSNDTLPIYFGPLLGRLYLEGI